MVPVQHVLLHPRPGAALCLPCGGDTPELQGWNRHPR